GVTRRVEWPTTTLSICRPPGSEDDVVLVCGPEPNLRWRAYCDELLEHADRLGVSTVITLGALLADTAHTRPVPVTGTAYDAEAAERFGIAHSKYEGPTGITGVFQDECVQAGIPAISVWAAVPHYVSHAPSPKATLALLRKLEDILDREVPLGDLPEQADEWQRTVTELAEDDEEVIEYVRTLEERDDAELDLSQTSGEQIAADIERYLRRRRPGARCAGGSGRMAARRRGERGAAGRVGRARPGTEPRGPHRSPAARRHRATALGRRLGDGAGQGTARRTSCR